MNEVVQMPSATLPQITVTRLIKASPAQVFAALTERAHLERWFFSRVRELDAKSGGSYRISWLAKPGSGKSDHDRFGQYLEMVENERVVFEWRGESLPNEPPTRVTITLVPEAGGTRVHLVHDGWPTSAKEARDSHERGWGFYVEHLGTYLTGGPDARGAMNQRTLSVVVIERVVNAPAAIVFGAWADGVQMTRWWKNLKLASLDFRVGGQIRFEWESWAGHVEGAYTRIEQDREIRFTWNAHPADEGVGESEVAVVLEAVGAKTRVTITHAQNWTEEEAASHEEGWTASLADLEAAYVS